MVGVERSFSRYHDRWEEEVLVFHVILGGNTVKKRTLTTTVDSKLSTFKFMDIIGINK